MGPLVQFNLGDARRIGNTVRRVEAAGALGSPRGTAGSDSNLLSAIRVTSATPDGEGYYPAALLVPEAGADPSSWEDGPECRVQALAGTLSEGRLWGADIGDNADGQLGVYVAVVGFGDGSALGDGGGTTDLASRSATGIIDHGETSAVTDNVQELRGPKAFIHPVVIGPQVPIGPGGSGDTYNTGGTISFAPLTDDVTTILGYAPTSQLYGRVSDPELTSCQIAGGNAGGNNCINLYCADITGETAGVAELQMAFGSSATYINGACGNDGTSGGATDWCFFAVDPSRFLAGYAPGGSYSGANGYVRAGQTAGRGGGPGGELIAGSITGSVVNVEVDGINIVAGALKIYSNFDMTTLAGTGQSTTFAGMTFVNGWLTGTNSSAFNTAVAAAGAGTFLTGNQIITLTGDVTGSGTTAITTTIASNAVTTTKINAAAVTLAKIANAAASSKLLGSGASGSGASYAEITLDSSLTMTGTTLSVTASGVTSLAGTTNQVAVSGSTGAVTISLTGPHGFTTLTSHGVLLGQGTSAVAATAAMTDGQILVGQSSADPLPKTMSGDATLSAAGALTIAANAVTTTKINNAAVTLAKIQNASAASKLLGSGASGSGSPYAEITLGTGLTMTSTTLSVTAITAGAVAAYAGSTVPSGWLECDGSDVSRTTYADLFAAVGTTWGTGNGSTTFTLPNLAGRALIGAGTGSGLSGRTLAATGGEENHLLLSAEMPSHTHPPLAPNTTIVGNSPIGAGVAGAGAVTLVAQPTTGAAGGGASHNNMQPFAVIKWIIKT
jgi:microcystin-dependent protein